VGEARRTVGGWGNIRRTPAATNRIPGPAGEVPHEAQSHSRILNGVEDFW